MVRWLSDNKGRFPRRPFYEPLEIDRECEYLLAEFRRDLGLPTDVFIGTDDITRLIERHARSLDIYADLSADGPDVEGVTLFASQRKPDVEISSVLSENDRRSNRFRTTLTHELGHVHLHDGLFQEKLATGDLFARKDEERLACKRDTIVDAPKVDWLEWQACYFSGAILMPRAAVVALAREQGNGVSGPPAVDGEAGGWLVTTTMNRFQVSRDAARVRLLVLGLTKNSERSA